MWALPLRLMVRPFRGYRPLAEHPEDASDYHWGSILGLCRTYVFLDIEPPLRAPTEDDVMAALRARRTVVIDREGHAYGDPALTALVEKQPIPARAVDYRYRGEGKADRILRVLGFIGLVVIGRKHARRE